MAVSRVGGKNGAVSFLAAHGADFASWGMRFAQPVDDDTSYSDTGNGSSHAGSGTNDYNLSAAGFLKKGAAGSAPGFDSVSATGGAVTVTADTGCTFAATFILTGGSIDHGKRRGAIPVSYEGTNDGNLTEVWAVA
jgi:hypothetical protein